jgi:hypothetical protein
MNEKSLNSALRVLFGMPGGRLMRGEWVQNMPRNLSVEAVLVAMSVELRVAHLQLIIAGV